MKTNSFFCFSLALSLVLAGCSTERNIETASTNVHPGFISTVTFTGKQLLIGDSFWDVKTGKKLRDFLPQLSSAGVGAFSPDGRQLLVENNTPFIGGPTILWDVATRREIRRFEGLGGNLLDIQFSADASRLLTASSGSREVRTWDVKSGQPLLSLKGFQAPTTLGRGLYASFSPDGRKIVVLGWRRIVIYDSTTGSEIRTIKQEEQTGSKKPDFFVSTQFSPDGKRVLTEQCNGTTRIWEADSGKEVRSFAYPNHSGQSWPQALFAPNGREVISGADNGIIVLWDINSGREIRRFLCPGNGWGPVEQMIISRDGKRLISACERAGAVRSMMLWDIESGALLRQFDDPYEAIVGFSPTDETFITIRANKPDQLWDGATGKIIRRYDSATTASDAHDPCDLLLSGNVLYGLASAGNGAVFKVNTDGTGFEILHGFTATRSAAQTNHDGTVPRGMVPAPATLQGMILSRDALYGTAQSGGDAGHGTIFKVKADGTDFTVLHSFENRDGISPAAGLILSGRTLYGTTLSGGSGSNGTVFKVDVDGANFAVLHTFTPITKVKIAADDYRWTNSDGSQPGSGIALSGHTLYGGTMRGGQSAGGTIFRVNTDGTDFAVLHEFAPWQLVEEPRRITNSDGFEVVGLVCSGDTLYGATSDGGVNGAGTLFKIGTDGAGFSVLKAFLPPSTNHSDGFGPGGLSLSGNTLYVKPSDQLSGAPGTAVVKINLDGTGFSRLPIFTDSAEVRPMTAFVPAGDTAYGATMYGGKEGGGIVFKINLDGTGFKVIHSFPDKWRLLPSMLSD